METCRRLILLAAIALTAASYPPGSNVVNVEDYGAIPDDGLDDTAAFQAAIRDAVNVGRIFEVPNGRWTITSPLRSQILHGSPPTLKWVANWIVHCESPAAVIEVPENTPAYSNGAAPQAVFAYGSTTNNAPNPNNGSGVEAYRNQMHNCTIEVGAGNPGARAIDWVCNNRGVIRNVRILSADGQGDAGIWAGRPWPGPCLIEDVEIQGFKNGIWDGFVQYGLTINRVYLHGQTAYGINATADVLNVQGLRFEGAVPGIRSESGAGHLTLLDSTFTRTGGTAAAALSLGANSKAYLRNVSASGYTALLKQASTVRTDLGLSQAEWVSHTPIGDGHALDLPVVEPPRVFESSAASDRADPRDYGANPSDGLDDRGAVQAALDSGKPIVALYQAAAPALSRYRLSGPVYVPCGVRLLDGMESLVEPTPAYPIGQPWLVFDADCDWSDVTVVQGVWTRIANVGGPQLLHADARTLYVRDAYFAAQSLGIHAAAGSGRLFLSNVVTSDLTIDGPHEVWATQLNVEGLHATGGAENNGGTLRILGFKTEGLSGTDGTQPTLTVRGGRTEILGGMMMPCVGQGTKDVTLGFVLEDEPEFSATYTNWCGKTFDLATWDTQVRRVTESGAEEVYAEDLPTYAVEGGNRVAMSLYSYRPPVICEAP